MNIIINKEWFYQLQPPAALFEHVIHYSDIQPAPSPRPLRLRFHSSVAPSPSTSNQSKSSLLSEPGATKPSEDLVTQKDSPQLPKVNELN